MAQQQPILPRASEPLELASRPVPVIEHPIWTAARDAALSLVTSGPCLVLLLGPAGSAHPPGDLAKTFVEVGWTTSLRDSGDSESVVGVAEFVLVDEAHRMRAERLDELSWGDGRAIVLAALPSLRRPVPALAHLGLPSDYLTEAARARLIAQAHGVPRLLISLLRLALIVAAEDDSERVTEVHVELAVEVRVGDAEETRVEPTPAEADPARRLGVQAAIEASR